MKKLDIYLVDDHSLFREGLRFLLSGLDFVNGIFEAENGCQLLEGLKNHPVDLVLLDIEMPKMNGIDTAHKVQEINPNIKIIALSMYSDENYYTSMIEAGADGFLLKNSSFSEVKKTILDVCQGKSYFSAKILQSIVKKLYDKTTEDVSEKLTARETDVLRQICRGYSNPEIAEILSISKRTVDKHRENLLQKTYSKNTASLVVYAIKHGYFEI